MNNSIIDFLNLKDEEIESLTTQSLPDELVVNLVLKKRILPCPHCSLKTSQLVNTYTRKINHGLFIDRRCTVFFHQKRYFCTSCKTSFTEPCQLVSKGQKKSLASVIQVLELLKSPHMTFKKVGELLHLSTTTVQDIFYQNCPKHKSSLPRVLCIDEVYLGRNSSKKYVAVLLDFESGLVVDIIYGRTKDALHSYFQRLSLEERQQVEYLSVDLFEGYRFLNQTYLKNAKVCTDAFHVIQIITTMFDKQIRLIQNRLERNSIEYYLLKKERSLLMMNHHRIEWYQKRFVHKLGYTVSNQKLKDMMFGIDPLIEELYNIKEDYIQFNGIRDRQIAETRLLQFIQKCIHHTHPEVRRIGRTFSKWSQEILNSFVWFDGRRISNGPIESRNNTIKLIIRNAAGYRNFDHLKARILYCINQPKER